MSAVVIDTSVLVAGLLSRQGAAAALVSAFFGDRLRLAYTPDMMREYGEVLERPEFAPIITTADRLAILMKLRASGLQVVPAAVPAIGWPDADDVPFVAAALATERKIVVTLNRRDFVPAEKLGVRVLSPAEARRILLSRMVLSAEALSPVARRRFPRTRPAHCRR